MSVYNLNMCGINMQVGMPHRDAPFDTVCPRSSAPFYVITYYIKWVTTSWTYSNNWMDA